MTIKRRRPVPHDFPTPGAVATGLVLLAIAGLLAWEMVQFLIWVFELIVEAI